MKSLAKKILTVAVAAACAAAMCLFGACSSSHEDVDPTIIDSGNTDQDQNNDTDTNISTTGSGTDTGTDTETETIINNTINNYYLTMTDDQFQAYLDFLSSSSSSDTTAIEAASARSVFSSVSILTFMTFQGTKSSGMGPGAQRVPYYYDNAYNGSGVIVDLDKEAGDAYVLTNCHVVYDDSAVTPISSKVYLYLYGQDIEYQNYTIETTEGYYQDTDYSYTEGVTTGDESYRIEATVVAASVQYDMALLKVSGSEVLMNSSAVAAEFAEDDEAYIGQSVYAVGNPLGAGTTVTTGVVSKDSEETQVAVDSSIYTLYREIKTDTVVNPGNSGGALYNSSGKIIGLVNAGLTTSSSGDTVEGTSFALSGSYVKRIYQLMKDTQDGTQITDAGISRAYLAGGYQENTTKYTGYSVQDSIDTGYEAAYSYSTLDLSGTTPRARIIEEVAAATDSYGLEEGDVITHLTITAEDGETVIEDLDITRKFLLDDALISYRDGYTVTLTYTRDGQAYQKSVECEWITQA